MAPRRNRHLRCAAARAAGGGGEEEEPLLNEDWREVQKKLIAAYGAHEACDDTSLGCVTAPCRAGSTVQCSVLGAMNGVQHWWLQQWLQSPA